ncbi:MAG: deaminase [Clostridiales bacterium]|nr:deaminase [Clostridiales bacterium]
MAVRRVDKINYYLNIAETVLERSTCLRRNYGAIIVQADEVIATGYNGAPRGRKNCIDLGRCTREELQIPSGQRYELCRSVHAEANAIISAARSETLGATLYLVGRDAQTGRLLQDTTCCSMCRRLVINAGIQRVVVRNTPTDYTVIPVQDWIDQDDTIPEEAGCGE